MPRSQAPGGYGDRDAFLGRVRARLTDGIPENPLRPFQDLDASPIEYRTDGSDLVTRFTAAARAAGADVHEDGDTASLVRDLCETRAIGRAVVSGDPECAGLAELLEQLGVSVAAPGDIAAVAEADLGITGSAYGIAQTGSLVVDSGRAAGRTASLLPPLHLALLRRDAILATPGDLWRDLDQRLPDGLPSNLVLITGPSRTGDIEMQLITGVHGPREVIVALL